jgi:hypothetical protein
VLPGALGVISFVAFFITFLVWLFASSFFLWRSSGRPTGS